MSFRKSNLAVLLWFVSATSLFGQCTESSWTVNSVPMADGTYVLSKTITNDEDAVTAASMVVQAGDRLVYGEVYLRHYRDGVLLATIPATSVSGSNWSTINGAGVALFGDSAGGQTDLPDGTQVTVVFDGAAVANVEKCDELKIVVTGYEAGLPNPDGSYPLVFLGATADHRQLGWEGEVPDLSCHVGQFVGNRHTDPGQSDAPGAGPFANADCYWSCAEIYFEDGQERIRMQLVNKDQLAVSVTVKAHPTGVPWNDKEASPRVDADGWYSLPLDRENPFGWGVESVDVGKMVMTARSSPILVWIPECSADTRFSLIPPPNAPEVAVCERTTGITIGYELFDDWVAGSFEILIDGDSIETIELEVSELQAGQHAVEVDIENMPTNNAEAIVVYSFWMDPAAGPDFTDQVSKTLDGMQDCFSCGCATELMQEIYSEPGGDEDNDGISDDFEQPDIDQSNPWKSGEGSVVYNVDDVGESPRPSWFQEDHGWPSPKVPIMGDSWLDFMDLGIDPDLITEESYAFRVNLPITFGDGWTSQEYIFRSIPENSEGEHAEALNDFRIAMKSFFNLVMVLTFGTAAVRMVARW